MSATSIPGAPARAARRRSPAEWFAAQDKRELALWGALLGLALVLRLWDLGARPFHHDESQDAYFSWTFQRDVFGGYSYDPLLHGPFRFFLTAIAYTLFGASDFTARLAPALMGVTLVGLPFLLRRQLGRIAAFAAAVLFAVGPSFLYYSRFAREDIYFAALSMGLIVAAWRYLDRPTRHGPAVILGLVAAMFACKETAFISLFVAGLFFIPAALIPATGVWEKVSRVGWRPWAWGLVAFLVVWGIFFGVLFTQWAPGGARNGYQAGFVGGFTDGIHYWLDQQDVARGNEQPWLYPAILIGDEWPTLLLGLVGIAWVLRRRTVMRVFLVVAFLGQLAIYMWASERFAWLVLHPLLPLVLLAGLGVQALWRASRVRRLQALAALILLAGLAGTAHASFRANAQLAVNPRELLVTTQSGEDVKAVVDEVRAMGPGTTITVDTHDGATFPYAWYFRDDPVGYIDMTTPGYRPDTDVLITTEAGRDALGVGLDGYRGREFQFRVWWVRTGFWDRATPGAWLRYVGERETFSPTGGLKEWFYVKR